MAVLTKTQPTINELKKRDAWEKKVRLAFHQREVWKREFDMYTKNYGDVCQRYERWLKRKGMEATFDINQYK